MVGKINHRINIFPVLNLLSPNIFSYKYEYYVLHQPVRFQVKITWWSVTKNRLQESWWLMLKALLKIGRKTEVEIGRELWKNIFEKIVKAFHILMVVRCINAMTLYFFQRFSAVFSSLVFTTYLMS